MARPKKYTPDYLDKLADELLKWINKPNSFWLKDFAIENGFASQQMTVFADSNEKFSLALKMAKDIQESKLVKMGFNKKYNCTMAIFALKNVAGWRDSKLEDTDLTDTEIQKLKQIANSQIEANL